MIENLIRASTCQIICGEEFGSGILVSEKIILTARHCILKAIDSNDEIKLTFPERGLSTSAKLFSDDKDLDICLLIIELELDLEPISFSHELPREGFDWYSVGFPLSKRETGHRVNGEISQTHKNLKNKMDLDLSIDSKAQLEKYNGLSGSALICNGLCVGVLRLKVGNSLGAISISKLTDFLDSNGVKKNEIPKISKTALVERIDFQNNFETKLNKSTGDYYFLEGANGIGKSTFCFNYEPNDITLSVLGCYGMSTNEDDLGAAHQVQPYVFYDWLLSTISIQISGKAARKEDKDYATMVKETARILEEYANDCLSIGKKGLLFIDGINEGFEFSEEILTRLIGLLPLKLPKGLSIIFTASNFDNLNPILGGRVKIVNKFELVGLHRSLIRAYCWKEIQETKATSALISLVCDKAQGHPLYLRYLIEFINNFSNIDKLSDFPQFDGVVANYYEKVWTKLHSDPTAINLLAIICRLRWGVNRETFAKILTQQEISIHIPTLSRIRHLLESSDSTTIYHLSFAEFLKEKTFDLNDNIEKRLSDFCIENVDIEYCCINSVFHSLKSDLEYRNRAIEICCQSWVDNCVILGVKPDTILFDIEDILKAVTETGTTVDIIRILLLSHRINFRYNYLFSQSAPLISEALIALNKPNEALYQITRFDSLNVYIEEAIRIAIFFINNENKNQARKLLHLLDESLEEMLTSKEHNLKDYLDICRSRLRTLVLLNLVEENIENNNAHLFISHVLKVIRKSKNKIPEEIIIDIVTDLNSVLLGFAFCFKNRYTTISRIKLKVKQLPPNMLEINISSIYDCLYWLGDFKKIKKADYLPDLFKDIEEMVSSEMFLDSQTPSRAVDTLIQIGAPSHLIKLMAGEIETPENLIILGENGVDLDFKEIYIMESKLRVASFVSTDMECQKTIGIESNDFKNSLDAIYKTLIWCEGKARFLKADNNNTDLLLIYDEMIKNVIFPLNIKLKERVSWLNSYSIPESIFPEIYKKISEIHIDCFPSKIFIYLENIHDNFDNQLGVYSEGFIEIIFNVIDEFSEENLCSKESDLLFSILVKLKEYIVDNIQNSQELVPNLLKLIPLFVKLNGNEIAGEIYKIILKCSMGPNWYKEDQFSLLITLLNSSDILKHDEEIAIEVAAYLERASGEMTFQRFVRYEKSNFIGELMRSNRHTHAIQYFKRQTCGSLEELYADTTSSNVDRVDSLRGIRFPGGAIEEQDAIHQIVQNANDVNWRLSWSLLEIYLFGDERYIDRYAKEFAKLVNFAGINDELLSEMRLRLEFHVLTELSFSNQIQFLITFQSTLKKIFHDSFSSLFGQISEKENSINSNEKVDCDTNNNLIETDNEEEGEDEDQFYLPGTFGRKKDIKASKIILNDAISNIQKGNQNKSRDLAINALQVLQEGGWPIWGNMGETVDPIMEILHVDDITTDQICHLYAPLLCEERYAPRWQLAEHLIRKCANRLDKVNTVALSQLITKHIGLIVGNSTDEKDIFKFLKNNHNNDISEEFVSLIIWLIDHPQLLRKDKAVDTVRWFLDKDSTYYNQFISSAFSMKTGFAPDAICGILDELSEAKPLEIWRVLKHQLDLKQINKDCKHISRLVILKNIAERASKEKSKSAIDFLSYFPNTIGISNISEIEPMDLTIPEWADSINKKYNNLISEELISDKVINTFIKEMTRLCTPLDIEVAWKLEKLVLDGFNVAENGALNRWDAKLNFALNVALYKSGCGKFYDLIERSMRIYNPNFLKCSFGTKKESMSDKIQQVLAGKLHPESLIFNDGLLLLNYQEMICNNNDNSTLQVEILASLTSSYYGYAPSPLSDKSLFSSNEHYLELEGNVPANEIYYRVAPKFVYMGIFTPAIPTNDFMKFTKTSIHDFQRLVWRDGRSSHSKSFGRPILEGCFLALKKHKLSLPINYKITWFIKINNNILHTFSRNLEQIR